MSLNPVNILSKNSKVLVDNHKRVHCGAVQVANFEVVSDLGHICIDHLDIFLEMSNERVITLDFNFRFNCKSNSKREG